jgi:8-oxo-dGTP pyrophosphatase MutT (NUDIX family)
MKIQIHIVAKTLVFRDDYKLLLLIRSDDDIHRPGGYDLPGGQVDNGEEPLLGGIREAGEEAGLALQPADMQLVFATSKTDNLSEAKPDINLVWMGYVSALPAGAVVRLSHEHKDFLWVTIDEAMALYDGGTQLQFLNYLKGNSIAAELWQPRG